MKPVPAIIEPAQVDVGAIEHQIAVELAGERDDVRIAERHEQMAGAARESAAARRSRIGALLCKARVAWPERGPKAKGWGEFLARLKIDDATARRYMDEHRDPAGFAQRQRKLSETSGGDPGSARATKPATKSEEQLAAELATLDPAARKRVIGQSEAANVKGGSGETARGTWCTSAKWARAIGRWSLDPLSNPRSHIDSDESCMLENGGDGLLSIATPGSYRTSTGMGVAGPDSRVFLQPPFELVAQAIAHYRHTRFCALLRWSPDVKAWFPSLWERTTVVCHPFGERMEFEPPPGIQSSGDMPFPHALYYADERDVTDEVCKLCLVWRVDHSLDARNARH